ncbi:MAG TPA: DUF262 domain-containing protein [Chitinophagales bacterium]|nr:DUF262 domain-containing protein [Chitinophagales bacterium]
MKNTQLQEKRDIRAKLPYMSQVNLDALIPREDLEIKEIKNLPAQSRDINISFLQKGQLWVESLRKPQFQRSTWEWSPEKVYGLIKSFTDGDLIPAIILWKGEGNVFVIDGAHRLSALMAWVNDDYGYGAASRAFFGDNMERGQIEKAKQVKKLIEENIGRYSDIVHAGANQNKAPEEWVKIAQRINGKAIDLQWVPGDASQAEESFFKINEAASPLDATEKRLLRVRNKPMAIGARAIIRAGRGHKYWNKFSDDNQQKIEDIAYQIHEWLFKPELVTPVKTYDIPLAGKSYSDTTQELILNVVNFSNNIKIVDPSKLKKKEDFPEFSVPDEATDGVETIHYLANTKKMLSNIVGVQSSSLGLHPAVYFYSHQGRYQITAFMAIMNLIKDYDNRNQLVKFTTVRKKFEEFLWKHKILVHQATNTWGSGAKGYVSLTKAFDFIIQLFLDNKTEEQIISELDSHEDYNFFKPNVKPLNPKFKKDFSTESKSEVFLRDVDLYVRRCNICNGFLHINSIQIGHEKDKKDGGIGNAANGRLEHPYCNSIKDKLIEIGFYKPQNLIGQS